jgi:hypothetical protein
MSPGTSSIPPPPGTGQPGEEEVRTLLLRLLQLVAAEAAQTWRRQDNAVVTSATESPGEGRGTG